MFRKKKNQFEGVTELKPLRYPTKVLIGWNEAIGGNKDLRDWFMQSDDFKELGIFVHALLLKEDARNWLMENGYAHLMAMINGAEGSKEAIHWLEKAGFKTLQHVALAGDGDDLAFEWLKRSGQEEFAMISMTIRRVKDEIEADHEDIHKFGRD